MDNDNTAISYLRSIIRYAVAVVGVITRTVLSHLAIATTTRTFDDLVNTEKFLRILVTTYCSRHSIKHNSERYRYRYSSITKRDRDRSFESKTTSSLAYAVLKIANRVPKTIVQRVDVLKRAPNWHRDENYDWSYIRMKFIDTFSQHDISRSKSDDTNVCATVTWNVIE